MMARKAAHEKVVPTDEEILAYDNVPAEIAASYIGWSRHTLYYALQDGRAPFGFVSERESNAAYTGLSYAYNISPGLLVAYKRGTLHCPKERDIVRMLRDAVRAIEAGEK